MNMKLKEIMALNVETVGPDATLQDDADFAWATLVQLLRELAK